MQNSNTRCLHIRPKKKSVSLTSYVCEVTWEVIGNLKKILFKTALPRGVDEKLVLLQEQLEHVKKTTISMRNIWTHSSFINSSWNGYVCNEVRISRRSEHRCTLYLSLKD